MKKFFAKLLPILLCLLSFIIQIAVIFLSYIYITSFPIITIISNILVVIVALILVNSKSNSSFKISWFFLIAVAPIFGAVVYLIFANKGLSFYERRKIKPLAALVKDSATSIQDYPTYLNEIEDANALNISTYLKKCTHVSIFKNTTSEYYKSGEVALPKMLEELRKAKSFIYLEYFIIAKGKMWNSILEILKEKAQQGLDVRVLYDDFGSLGLLEKHYPKKLEKFGIKACVVNKVVPLFDIRMNNRDHRKIMVIDGEVGFTGGINIADEYINQERRFGYWKDNAIKLVGDAVVSLTNTFLLMWYISNKKTKNLEFLSYKTINKTFESDGYVQPYFTFPFDRESVGQNFYISLILKAKKFIYISTPYLILDEELENALCTASKSGVDVRIVTPYIPDKKLVFELTKSHFAKLHNAGVKLYSFKPGFNHNKIFLVDDEMASVGTMNLDYRSLFLHSENGVFLYKTSSLKDIKEDFIGMFNDSILLTKKQIMKVPLRKKILRFILKVFAPLT